MTFAINNSTIPFNLTQTLSNLDPYNRLMDETVLGMNAGIRYGLNYLFRLHVTALCAVFILYFMPMIKAQAEKHGYNKEIHKRLLNTLEMASWAVLLFVVIWLVALRFVTFDYVRVA